MAFKQTGIVKGDLSQLASLLHSKLSAELEQEMLGTESMDLPNRLELSRRLRGMIEDESIILSEAQIDIVEGSILDRITGLDILEPLLNDHEITEIMVNDPEHVFIERHGKIEEAGIRFRDESHLRHIIERIVAPIGRRIDESCPMVDARLPDGSRVNAVISPLTIGGPALTIRKERRSMIISGGTGSGKTSTLNALSRCIPDSERLITIEDSAELQLLHSDLIALEARQPNIEGKGEIPIRQLVRNALRMRPDRIIVGEVRGGEAFDMLQAMNTGHRGSLTTLHANSPEDALIRLESMVLMAGFELPLAAIRRMIAGAIEIIIQQDRFSDGRRLVTAITELKRIDSDGIQLTPRFVYDPESNKSRRNR
jgi:pilus assembly protein CpaF